MSILPTGRKRRFRFLLSVLVLGAVSALVAPHLWAWYHFRAAQTAVAQYHFPEVRTHVERCLKTWPNSWRVHLLAARAARLNGDSRAAEQHLYRCQELQSNSPPEVLLEWSLLHATSGDLKPVEEFLRQQMRLDSPETPLIRAALIEGYLRMYRLAEAHADLEDWLKQQPENTQALFLQGGFWQQVQRPELALDSYRRVIELDPERDDARWRLAQCLVRLDLPEEALPHLEHLHQRHPDNREMTVELARGQFKQGRLPQARQLLDAVLTEHPHDVAALTERGRLALADDEVARAEHWLRQAIAYSPNDPQAVRLLANVLFRQGKRDEAQRLQDRFDAMDRDFKRLEGICMRELGERPNDPALHCELGKLLLRLGYKEAGRAWLLRTASEDPTNASARAALADLDHEVADTPNRR